MEMGNTFDSMIRQKRDAVDLDVLEIARFYIYGRKSLSMRGLFKWVNALDGQCVPSTFICINGSCCGCGVGC